MIANPPDADRVRKVQQLVVQLAETRDVKVVFQKVKRRTDITMFSLRGERSAVISVPGELVNRLEGIDLELLRSEYRDAALSITLVITDELASQDIQFSERRNKLKLLAQQVRAVLTQPQLQDA